LIYIQGVKKKTEICSTCSTNRYPGGYNPLFSMLLPCWALLNICSTFAQHVQHPYIPRVSGFPLATVVSPYPPGGGPGWWASSPGGFQFPIEPDHPRWRRLQSLKGLQTVLSSWTPWATLVIQA